MFSFIIERLKRVVLLDLDTIGTSSLAYLSHKQGEENYKDQEREKKA